MDTPKKITIIKDGPYQVSGFVPLAIMKIETNPKGESTKWIEGTQFRATESYSLCRCGKSNHKPFCDSSHVTTKFNGAETASHKPFMEQADMINGPGIMLADAEELCACARFCDLNGRVWNQVANSGNAATCENLIRQTGDCASGRLVAIDKVTEKALEPELPKSIGVIEDPSLRCSGPLWIRGGIELIGSNGKPYEVRNRMTLCRCGRSQNKPFCNGVHAADPKFQDGL